MRNWLGLLVMLPLMASAADRVLVPAGAFQMGCSEGDAACGSDEGPVSPAASARDPDGCYRDLAGSIRPLPGQCAGPARYAR